MAGITSTAEEAGMKTNDCVCALEARSTFVHENNSNGSQAECQKLEHIPQQTAVRWAGREGLKCFCNETTCHGVRYVWRGTYPLRIMWVLAVSAAFAGFLYFFVENLKRYKSYPSNVVVITKPVQSLPYPAITICNQNPVQRSRISDNPTLQRLIEAYFCIHQTGISGSCNRDASKEVLEKDATPVSASFLQLGQNASQLFVGLSTTKSVTNLENILPTVTTFGLCQTINADGQLKASSIGVNGGLSTLLLIDQSEYFPLASLSAGLNVFLHQPGEPVIPGQQGIAMGTGQEVFVSITAEVTKLLDTPYTKQGCESKNPLRFYKKYTQNGCLIECLAVHIAEECECVLPGIQNTSKVELYDKDGNTVTQSCTFWNMTSCVNRYITTFYQESLWVCPTCLLPCDGGLTYSASISHQTFPSNAAGCVVADLVGKGDRTCTENQSALYAARIRDNYLVCNFYFEHLSYTVWEQKKQYGLDALFGDFGGNLGLFLGASLLTVVELAQFLTRCLKEVVLRGQEQILATNCQRNNERV